MNEIKKYESNEVEEDLNMLSLRKGIVMALLAAVVFFGPVITVTFADDYEPVKSLLEKYRSGDASKVKEAADKLRYNEPRTHEDMDQLRKIFSNKTWNAHLYGSAVNSIREIKDPSLDEDLINILQDEKPLMEKVGRKEKTDKSETEVKMRSTTAWFAIEKLGKLKSQKAVPILKEFLNVPGLQYYASEALARIGDKSASEDIKDRAYRGESVNYGGQGDSEADSLIHDLQDQSKKDKWRKISKQLLNIRNPKAKPYLKKLFDHPDNFVRHNAVMAFYNLVNKDDAEYLMEMAKNKDYTARAYAVKSMMYLKGIPFDDILIDVLVNDKDWLPRSEAARALGMKKVQKAVPYLEKALKDENYYVRLEAFISLYLLMDKKYDFEGRNKNADSMAERQKKYPKINW